MDLKGWIVINFKNKPKVIKSTEMVVVDCEMVLCEDETEAVVKVCVVDHNFSLCVLFLLHTSLPTSPTKKKEFAKEREIGRAHV